MLKPVKSLVLLTLLLLHISSSEAQIQLKLPTISPTIVDVKKIIEDYPARFANITGALIVEHNQSADYACTINVSGAEEAFITKFAGKKNIASWQAVMFTTENFDKAKQKFKSLCGQFNNLSIKLEETNYKLKGDYNAPTEDLKFSSTVYSFTTTNENIKHLKVEVALQFNAPMEWEVKLFIYDREREDDEKGAAKDE
jgi:hypothetical protein